MIANIDNNVGALRSFLADEGIAENTIFIFTTDNGTSSGARVFNAGMRGRKGSEYDGGHRVPFFMHWPAAGLTGGRDVKPITAHVDVLPTLIDWCDIPAPESVKFDGVSLAPLIDGSASDSWPDRILVTDSQRVKDPIKWRKSAGDDVSLAFEQSHRVVRHQSDPGQTTNVADEHPDVVERLTDFYEAWWAELEPTFDDATAIHLGHPAENPARLTSHDWITTRSTPWNQAHVRAALTGEGNTGFWNVRVVEGGTYEIRLRRWPKEAGAAIDAGLPPGDDVPGVKPYRARPGVAIEPATATVRIGGQTASQAVEPGSKEVIFRMDLPEGKTRLSAVFETDEGQIYGAYYAYVERL